MQQHSLPPKEEHEGLVLTPPVSIPDFQPLPRYGSPEIFSRGCSKADRCGGTESGGAPPRAAFRENEAGRRPWSGG